MNGTLSKEKIDELKAESIRWQALKGEIQKTIVGQESIIERICIGLLCSGHILLEGVPGLAKTTLIKTISQTLGLEFARIQFTPDLLPSDLIGTLIYNPKVQEFQTRKGPIFANIVLADEINRAPAKIQSALLEAMQEHQVTIGNQTHALPKPFLVLATQNPIEQEGTYRLPEAQVDRFMFKLLLTYPSPKEEMMIMSKVFNPSPIEKVLSSEDIAHSRSLVDDIYIDQKVNEYMVNLVYATRAPQNYKLGFLAPMIKYGASPRATLSLHHAARAHAFLQKRYFVIPDDVKAIANDTMRHRIILSYEAEAEDVTPDDVTTKILEIIPSP